MTGQPIATKWSNPRRLTLFAAALALLTGLGITGVLGWRGFVASSSDHSADAALLNDPRSRYDGPYRNIHPDVRYIGDAQCTSTCHIHDDIARSFAQHPMGRSLLPVEAVLDKHRYTRDTNNPFTLLGRRFEVAREGKWLWHRQALLDDAGKPLAELADEVRWVIGSGAKGYSYLSEHDGFVFQTPISWFTRQQRWDLSPGFGPAVLTGRLVLASCLFCHANFVQEHPEHPDRFVPPIFGGHAIGCERCHGPGELHVRTGDRLDIVNPDRLTPQLRNAVCEQCHLEGVARLLRGGRRLFDFRPGLPLNEFWAVLVEERQSGENAKAVNHVEQMYQSKCFSRPVGERKLGCTSCHDPHVHIGPAQRQTYYRAKCLLCHDGAKGSPVCSEPLPRRKQVSPVDSCIDCHMPRYPNSDVAHAASTDHRIVRRPASQPIREPDLEKAQFVDFYRDRFPRGDPQTARTLGLGLVKMILENKLQPRPHADRAVRFLEAALARDPSDVAVREGKVEAYLLTNRSAEALSEGELLLQRQQGNWKLLGQAAFAANAQGQLDRARDYWRRAAEINPFVPTYQLHLLELLLRAEQLEEAKRHCEQLLRVDPFNVAGRQARVGFLLKEGKKAEAMKEFEVIRRLKPPDLAQREEWFRQQLR